MRSDSSPYFDLRTAGLSGRGVRPAYLISRLITSYLAYLVVMAVLVLVVPRFSRIFDDFKLRVALPTRALFEASRICGQNYLWLWLAPLPAFWAIGSSLAAGASNSRRRVVRLGAFVLVAVFLVFTVLALFFPMLAVLEQTNRYKP